MVLNRTVDAGGRVTAQTANDARTLSRGGPGRGGFIDGVTVLPKVRTRPLRWLTWLLLLALLLSPPTVEALAIGYTHDGRGNVATRTFDGQVQSFTHDALDRLASESGLARINGVSVIDSWFT